MELLNGVSIGTLEQVFNSYGGMNTNAASLRHEEQEQWDMKLVKVARARLNMVADLQMAGLTHPIRSVGVTTSFYERVNDMTQATVDMDGVTVGQLDRLTFDEVGVPIPVVHKEFAVNWRQLEASRTLGEPLDTTSLGVATRQVANTCEYMLAKGLPNFEFRGNKIYGYTNHPNRNTVNLAQNWANDQSTIISDVNKMRKAMFADNRFGPFILYVAKNLWHILEEDYSTEKGDRTFKERIEAFSDITAVRHADYLADNNVVMVQMTDDVVDLAVAQDISFMEFMRIPNRFEFMVCTLMAPRIKADRNDSCGIVHAQ